MRWIYERHSHNAHQSINAGRVSGLSYNQKKKNLSEDSETIFKMYRFSLFLWYKKQEY